MELTIQLGGGKVSTVFGDQGEADEVWLTTVADDVLLDLWRHAQEAVAIHGGRRMAALVRIHG